MTMSGAPRDHHRRDPAGGATHGLDDHHPVVRRGPCVSRSSDFSDKLTAVSSQCSSRAPRGRCRASWSTPMTGGAPFGEPVRDALGAVATRWRTRREVFAQGVETRSARPLGRRGCSGP